MSILFSSLLFIIFHHQNLMDESDLKTSTHQDSLAALSMEAGSLLRRSILRSSHPFSTMGMYPILTHDLVGGFNTRDWLGLSRSHTLTVPTHCVVEGLPTSLHPEVFHLI